MKKKINELLYYIDNQQSTINELFSHQLDQQKENMQKEIKKKQNIIKDVMLQKIDENIMMNKKYMERVEKKF